jgi:hypothetical protein
MIIHYFASRQEYNWCQIEIWVFRLASPWRVFCPLSKENKATGAIADINIL